MKKDFEILVLLINLFNSIPTVGKKNATKMALGMLKQGIDNFDIWIDTLTYLKDNLKWCTLCNNISNQEQCLICLDNSRDRNTLCIVSTWQDLLTLEEHQVFNGQYYVLMNEINLQKNITANDLKLDVLLERIATKKWKEIIIATNPTINGELTAQYIYQLLKDKNSLLITRIAHGLPVGSAINYADQFTLKKSLEGRKKIA